MNQTQTWISWLTSSNEKQWKEATLALGGLSPDSDVDIPSLVAALDSDLDDVVFWSIGALGSLGKRSECAIDKLMVLTDSTYLGVRQSSIRALSRITPDRADISNVFLKKLEDESEFVVCDVLSAFIEMNCVGPLEIEAIKKCLTSPSKHVAFQAEVTLRNIMLNSENA